LLNKIKKIIFSEADVIPFPKGEPLKVGDVVTHPEHPDKKFKIYSLPIGKGYTSKTAVIKPADSEKNDVSGMMNVKDPSILKRSQN
jgi:hypothetical protein